MARVIALVSLSLATLVVARTNGPAGVGVYALIRVLPGLIGVVISAGLPGAVTYFLAGPDRTNRRLPLTVVAMALIGGIVGAVLWMAGAPLFAGWIFPKLSLGLVLLAGVTVLTQLFVATAKSSSQGTDDLPGANRVIVNEEFMFLPAYGALWFIGLHGYAASIAGLLLADVATSILAWRRLARRGFFRHAAPPSTELGRRIADYGLRAQLGGIVTLLNLRLDFILLNVLAGPAVLGVYAIASKFAELLKIPPLALTYVLYPKYAREDDATARSKAKKLLPKAGILDGGIDCSALVRGHIPHPSALWIGLQGCDRPGAHHPLRTGPRGCRRSHHRVPLRDRAAGVELLGDGSWARRDRVA